jgi:protein-disulfide isomerase
MGIRFYLTGSLCLFAIAGAPCATAQALVAKPCVGPTTQQKLGVAAYLAKKNHSISADDFTLVKSEDANDGCYWKLEYEGPQKKHLIVYLSPDRTFLSSELYDLRVDPLLEERAREESVMTAMLADEPPLAGSASAPVSVVEFSDFECPFCQKLKGILEQEVLPKAGARVSVAFRNFPLPMHPWAKPAAMMAACAALQDTGSFWKVHDFLFDSQRVLTSENLKQKVADFVSSSTSLDPVQFQKCVDKDLALGIVTKDLALGQENGVRATPTVFVNGVRYEGVQSAVQLLAIINGAANGSSASSESGPSHAVAKGLANRCENASPKSN